MDRFSREGEWSVSRVMAALQDWRVQFYSFNEPFLDTTGPFSGFLIPLFGLARPTGEHPQGQGGQAGNGQSEGQPFSRRASGKAVGRPAVADKVDAGLVAQMRSEGKSWAEIAKAHPSVKLDNGHKVRPSAGSIRRAWDACQKA